MLPLLLLTGVLTLSGCVNGLRYKKVTSDRAYLNASNLTLAQVIRTTSSPATQVDLIGNGSGALAKSCNTLQNAFGQITTATPSGASTCKCAFRYYRSVDANEEPIATTTDTIYREPDLIRCALPAELQSLAINTVQVSVQYGADSKTAGFSNEVPFVLSSSSGYAIDPTAASSFVPVTRFQCTAVVTYKPNYWGDVYDRDLSEDPRATTPMNFYTTNIGQSLALTAQGYKSSTTTRPALKGWDCPANPLDPRIQYSSTPSNNKELLGTSYTQAGVTKDFGPDFKNGTQPLLTKYDMRIFSAKMRDMTPDSRGDDTLMIYPRVSDSQKNKTDFFLLKAPAGAFRIPVNAIVAPGINTDPSGEKGPLPIGYAALSKPTANQEICPSSEEAPIPAGYQYAKLWLFRSSLVQRSVMGFEAGAVKHFNNKELACVGSAAGLASPPSNSFAFGIPSACPSGNCRFELSPVATSSPATYTASSGVYSDNWNMVLGQEPQNTSSPTTQVFDYLYVVSPISISREQILSGEAAEYIPYRYTSSLDCRDGSTVGSTQCVNGRAISNYVLSEDIGYAFSSTDLAYDQVAVGSASTSKFPLCVLVKEGSI